MILYFMKQDALAFLKNNMDILYTNYFTQETSDWIEKEYGQEAFEFFKEVPDIELSYLDDKSAGEVDFENIMRVYLGLKNISESQASDERLWAGLCNKVFYPYLRKRWGYDVNDIKDAEKDVKGIISRFFFTNPARGYYFRNTISKCWWVGRLTFDEKRPEDTFYYLKVIGSSDLNSKITEIFYNSTFTSNPMILKGLFDALALFYERKIHIPTKEVLRPALSYLNAVGGCVLLDAYDEIDIKKILVDKISDLLMGNGNTFLIDDSDDEDEEDVPEMDEVKVKQYEKPLQVEEMPTVEVNDEKAYVDKGCTVYLEIVETEEIITRKIPDEKFNGKWYPIDKWMLGKRAGDIYYHNGKHFKIVRIEG